MARRARLIQGSAAIGALVLGLLIYILDRQPGTVYFVPEWIYRLIDISPLFGAIGNQLPTFVHVYAFILLTISALGPLPRLVLPICLLWFSIDSLFEIAQHTAVAPWITHALPTWLDDIPILENSANYFQAGRFDWFDILSIAIGSLAAYLTILMSNHKEGENVIHY